MNLVPSRENLAALLMGGCVGALLASLGVWIMARNEQKFGSQVSSYQLEWAAVPALPGMMLHGVSNKTPDRQLGEQPNDVGLIIMLNAACYGLAGVGLCQARHWLKRYAAN